MKKILMAFLLCIPALLMTGCVTETTSTYPGYYSSSYPYTNTYYGTGYYGTGYYGGYGVRRVARAAAWGSYYDNNWYGTNWRGGAWNRAGYRGGLAHRAAFHGGGVRHRAAFHRGVGRGGFRR